MSNPKYLCIDLFCGFGGTTTGMEQAVDKDGNKLVKVIACVNHDPVAIQTHRLNHPHAIHFIEDVRNPVVIDKLAAIVAKAKMEHPNAQLIIWASLECTNFSNAKGGAPRDADSRTLANHLLPYIDQLQPDLIMIENVREFMAWGPLDGNGKPISRKNGRDYLRWIEQVKDRGYQYHWKLLNSADYGAYTSRLRYFGIFALPNTVIHFPRATHSKQPRKTEGLFGKPLKKWKAVKEVLDFSDEGKSIFEKRRGKYLVDRTLKRIYAGLVKYVAGGEDIFLTQNMNGNPEGKVFSTNWIVKYLSNNPKTGVNSGASVEQPAPVVSTQNRLAIASVNFIQKNYSGNPKDKVISVDEPAPTVTTVPHESLVTTFMQEYYGNGQAKSIEQRAGTLTTKDRLAVVWLDKQYRSAHNHQSVEAPAGTVMKVDKHALVTAVGDKIINYLINPQYGNGGSSIEKPCFTLIAKMDKRPPYVVCAKTGTGAIIIYEEDSEMMQKIKYFMACYGIVDIKMRMLKVPELMRIQGFGNDYEMLGNQTQQKKFIGNSVVPVMAKVLVEGIYEANFNN